MLPESPDSPKYYRSILSKDSDISLDTARDKVYCCIRNEAASQHGGKQDGNRNQHRNRSRGNRSGDRFAPRSEELRRKHGKRIGSNADR